MILNLTGLLNYKPTPWCCVTPSKNIEKSVIFCEVSTLWDVDYCIILTNYYSVPSRLRQRNIPILFLKCLYIRICYEINEINRKNKRWKHILIHPLFIQESPYSFWYHIAYELKLEYFIATKIGGKNLDLPLDFRIGSLYNLFLSMNNMHVKVNV